MIRNTIAKIRIPKNTPYHTKIFTIQHQAFNAGKTDLQDHQEILFLTEVGVYND